MLWVENGLTQFELSRKCELNHTELNRTELNRIELNRSKQELQPRRTGSNWSDPAPSVNATTRLNPFGHMWLVATHVLVEMATNWTDAETFWF